MKRNILTALTLISLTATGSSLAATTAHEHGETAAKLMLNAGKKWETDAPLRKAMGSIRKAMTGSLHAIHEDRLSASGYKTLAGKIEPSVGDIVANCKLGTQADAQLHLVIADLLTGAEEMAGKHAGGNAQQGAVKVIGALNNYAAYFRDPGFKPIAH